MFRAACLTFSIIAALVALPASLRAETVVAAVAANFSSALNALEPAFESQTGHELVISSGSTGQLFARIVHGAPYDVYLAADRQRPREAVERGLAVPETNFTYALGQIALYAPRAGRSTGPELLSTGVRTLSIANPNSAPYGAAAKAALQSLGVWDKHQGNIAQARDVGGVYAAVRSGAADAGIVALAQLLSAGDDTYWLLPAEFYPPLRQDAVLLRRANDNPAAHALLEFLKSDGTRSAIKRFGYGVE